LIFVIRVLLLAAALYGAVVVLYLLVEPRKVYPAPKLDRFSLRKAAEVFGKAHAVDVQELALRASDGVELYGWRVGAGAKLVLYFSGNGTAVSLPEGIYETFLERGLSVVHVSYRGYPGSEGRPSEQGLIRDAHAAWEEALRTHKPDDIVVHGRSLGGGVATGLLDALRLAGDPLPKALILEATFTSAVDVARESHQWLPVDLLMRNRFLTLERLPSLELPTLIFHGKGDKTIPYVHAERLAACVPHAELYAASATLNHKDWLLQDPVVREAHAQFLARVFPADGAVSD